MVAGVAVIYAMGTLGFALVNDIGILRVFVLASMPFIPFEVLRIAVAVRIRLE